MIHFWLFILGLSYIFLAIPITLIAMYVNDYDGCVTWDSGDISSFFLWVLLAFIIAVLIVIQHNHIVHLMKGL